MESGERTKRRACARPTGGRRVTLRITLLAVALALAAAGARTQENFRTQVFRDADAARARAKELNADVLAPKSFVKAMDLYLDASEAFQRGRPLDEIQEKTRLAVSYFNQSSDEAKPALSVFSLTMAARSDALSADAMRSSADLWNKAESLFRSAATSLENGNMRTARSEAGDAQGLYRTAELEAIKANFLAVARDLLSRADAMGVKTTAPQTLERARKLANLAEAAIQQNRYENAEARRLAEEASYEAAHAIYLHQVISQLRALGRDYEDVILQSETMIAKVATALNQHVKFDAGFEPAIQEIIAALKSRDTARTELADTLSNMRAENENLHRRIATLERSAPAAADPSPNHDRKTDERKKHDQTVLLASLFFTSEDGVVLKEGSSVILRIYGLEFAPGKSSLDAQFSGLLSKIARAVRMFPNAQLTVEGNTESGGSETTNQHLSEARARAVAAYLRSVVSPSTPILSQGYGSSRPIADNGTAEGRARNRRIDIIIVPEWAIVGR